MRDLLKAIVGVGALLMPAAAAMAAMPAVIDLYPRGSLPQLPVAEYREQGTGNIWNVAIPTLETFAPAAGTANGTAIIVAPGGGFVTLVQESEGREVARRLAEHGFTAFVLKYRLVQTPAEHKGMPMQHAGEMAVVVKRAQTGVPAELPPFAGEPLAVQDGARAVRLLRERAAELHVDPARIGIVGFSAGAFLAADLAIGDKATRPDFVGLIYGGLRTPVPNDAPPAFIATAANDEMVPNDPIQLFSAWKAAGRPVELHVYERGGHGFGMTVKNSTSDHWLDEFVWWVNARSGASTAAK